MGKTLVKITLEGGTTFDEWVKLDFDQIEAYYKDKYFIVGSNADNQQKSIRTNILEYKSDYYYKVHISKNSPLNPNRGYWGENTPDNEYYRGCYSPYTYTSLKEAKQALAYYKKGHIEKKQHLVNFRNGYSSTIKTKIINQI